MYSVAEIISTVNSSDVMWRHGIFACKEISLCQTMTDARFAIQMGSAELEHKDLTNKIRSWWVGTCFL